MDGLKKSEQRAVAKLGCPESRLSFSDPKCPIAYLFYFIERGEPVPNPCCFRGVRRGVSRRKGVAFPPRPVMQCNRYGAISYGAVKDWTQAVDKNTKNMQRRELAGSHRPNYLGTDLTPSSCLVGHPDHHLISSTSEALMRQGFLQSLIPKTALIERH